MASVSEYLLVMTMLAGLGAILWLVFLPIRKKHRITAQCRSDNCYEAALLVWFMFLTGLFGLTLTPAGFWQSMLHGELPTMPPLFRGGINLRPFHESWSLLRYYAKHGLWDTILINFPGNILIFMPVGFFTALFSQKPMWFKSIIASAGLSCIIEFLQLFVSRGTDIDDLILNTVGGFLGFLLFLLLKYKCPDLIKSCSRF